MIKLERYNDLIKDLSLSSFDCEGLMAKIQNKTDLGNDFLGWVHYASELDASELDRIQKAATHIRATYDCLVVVGIGGSYLGSIAAIEALNGLFPSDHFKIIYLGNTLSPNYIAQVLDYLKDKKFAINIISKSGTTTEPAVSFRLLKEMLLKKYGHSYLKDAIYATTDKARGALKSEAEAEGYESFVIPDDVGGRYSVFTAVGLLPLAVSGVNIQDFIQGAIDGERDYSLPTTQNPAMEYALLRYLLNTKLHKSVELYVTYEPQYQKVTEWLKQLFGESEGKDKKGLFPASICCTTDLHSMGQFVQDGTPLLFETIIQINHSARDLVIEEDDKNLDKLNYLVSKKLSYINQKALEGTLEAHSIDGNVPCIKLSLDEMNAYNLGNLLYFFMMSCGLSAYLLKINPFNQEGVEIYKKNMFKLLGKPTK